ncbi:Mpped1 [Symbiodinium natans]|uniref:Mpped1 protein n=1 Tax=Symbiodinium natans TaxID=878477 RepID=A0A812SBT5_9DINO|nr:Mpped1 [Symbiodinium natans]
MAFVQARRTLQGLGRIAALRARGPGRLPWRRLASGTVEQLRQSLVLHPAVSQCVFIENVAYVVRKVSANPQAEILDSSVHDWELEKQLVLKATDWSISQECVPQVRVLDQLPGANLASTAVPFSLLHMLHVLFQEVDESRNGQISFSEFLAFCKTTKLFDTADKASEVFFSKRSVPTASELLFSENDFFALSNSESHIMKFSEFQQLMLDAGVVDVIPRTPGQDPHGAPLVSFFVDERIVDLILHHWFATYDSDSDGVLQLEDYARLVADYQLPLTASDEVYTHATHKHSGGLDILDFRSLLEKSSALATGTPIEKDDEMGRLWRTVEPSQEFAPPSRVFVADGRTGSSPPLLQGHLRFVCLSDTHGQHRELSSRLPPGDVLLHAGDFSNEGGLEEVLDFAAWIRSLPYTHKLLIAGNHDLPLDKSYHGSKVQKKVRASDVRSAFMAALEEGDDGVTYLEDEEIEIGGIRVYGTPWQPEFMDWAFNLPRHEIGKKWKAVPTGIDVLLVHGPPLGRGDALLPSLKRRGCADLLTEVQDRIRPQFCVFGHIHEGAGVTFDGTTHFVNASSMNEHYQCIHAPLVFDIRTTSSDGLR